MTVRAKVGGGTMTEQRKYVKLEIFIPETHFSALRKALQSERMTPVLRIHM